MFYACVMTYMMCLTFDLRLTIRNPLYPAKKRLTIYNIIVLLVTITFVIIGLIKSETSLTKLYDDVHPDVEKAHRNIETGFRWFLMCPCIVIPLSGGISTVQAIMSLQEPGIG